MIWERAARAFWPLFVAVAATVAAFGFGLVTVAPWVAAPLALALLIAGGWGLWRYHSPSDLEVRDRVDARLPGRPLAALADRAALGGEGALWQAHLAQMAARAAQARVVPARPDLARRDPYALRLAAMVALVMAGLFGGLGATLDGMGAVAATLRPDMDRTATAPTAPSWEGWAEPPAYTRRPTIYLNAHPEGEALTLPKGSTVSLRLYGEGVAVAQDIGPAKPGTDSTAPAFTAETTGTLTVADRRIDVTVLPDAIPVVAAGPPAERRADGRMVQNFTASDDFGLAEGVATFALDLASVSRRYGLTIDPEPREPLTLALPLPGGDRREVAGRIAQDVARHPFANLPVTLTLTATDGIGQVAHSEPLRMTLPGRRFFDPLAAALIEMRRDLLWSRQNAPWAAQVLRALIWQPEGFIEASLAEDLRGAVTVLEAGPLTEATRDTLAEALWQAAVKLEDGGLADALAAMKQAQERLSEAIRNGASPDEIQRLMDELKRATDAYTDMLAEQGADPAERFDRSPKREGQQITGDQIQQMMDEIQRLMNEGRMAEAQQLLDQFNRMMENLQVRQGQPGEGEGQPGRQAQQGLGESLRQQQDLADEAFREMQRQFSGQQGQPGEGQDGESLADRQRALREGLGRQRGMLPGQGTPEGDQAARDLDRAGRAMEEAEQALRDGDAGRALDRQAEAIEALREGMRALSDAQGRQQDREEGQQAGEGEQGQQPDGPAGQRALDSPQQRGEVRRDPLGRATGNGNTITSGDPLAEGTDPARRARDLLDEIRRRSGQRERPTEERDYLGRLLERF